MKLSNNALNFLLAQYHAIFKRAYVKGLASAVILTAGLGLAAGQAQAANTTEFYGYTNSITTGWKDATTTNAYVEFDDSNIRSVLRRLYNSTLDGIPNSDKVIAGAITHYSGSVQVHDPSIDGVDAIKHLNVIGATNTQLNSEGTGLVLTSNVNSGSLTLGKDGDIALNVVRGEISVQSAKEATGGAAFAGYAASYGSGSSSNSPAAISVTNSTLTVKDGFYADDAVIAGYALHAQAGTASVSGNTLDYTSNNVKQSNLYGSGNPGIPSTMLAAGYARSLGGSADAKSNTMTLSGDALALTNITEKTYFGGGYATLYDNSSKTQSGSVVEASNNSASLSNLSYNAETNTGKEAVIFGGYANTQGSSIYVGNATANGNKLSLTDVAITTAVTDTEVSIYGGYANNKTLSNSTDNGSSKVIANSNQLTIDAKAQNGTSIDMSAATGASAGITIVGGLAAQSSGDKNVTIEAKDNSLTVQGNVQITNADLYGARALNSVNNATSGGVTSAIGNTLTITGKAIVKDSSLLAASIKAVDNADGTGIIHEGNKVIVDSNSVVIASDGKTSEIAGDIVDVKGSVWAQNGGTVNFGGVVKEETASKYFHGTGSVTGTIYNQGTINVYNELDISQGTIYALGENATINVDGTDTKTAETNPSPLTAGYATLKTTEQQIKDYLTAESASNVALPVEHISDQQPTVISKSSAGILKVVSGGAVDFGTEVTLSDFNFSETATAGAIMVETTDDAGSTFKADTLTVAHKLASNTDAFGENPTKIENLTGIDASKVHLVANTLNLGSLSLTSAQSSEIDFADATASSEINFTVTTGDSGAQGYILSGAEVYGDNYTITNDAASNNTYYTTDTLGQINGKLQITEGGVLGVHNGDWEANDSITLVSGGQIKVGKSTVKAIGDPESLPDSTLVLNQALNFQMGTNDSGTVTVTGNDTDAYDFETAQETLGDDGLALLDLTAGINLVDTDGKTIASGSQIQGKATVKATSGGVVLLNGSNISSLVALDATNEANGLYLKAESGAALVIARDTGALNVGFGDFVSTNAAGINLNGDGILVADTINVTEPTPTDNTQVDDSGSDFEANYIDFAGTVHVADLTISDERRASNHTGFVKEAGIKSGTVYVYNSLTSSNATLQLGKADEADTEGAYINLVTPYVGDSGAVTVANIQLNNDSEFNVLNGTWDAANTAFNLTESGSMTIGNKNGSYSEDFAGDISVATLDAKSITMAAGTELYVANNGTATFATADFSDLAADADGSDNSAVTIYGSLTINDATITSESGAATTTYALFGGDGAITIGNNGNLTFGEAATSHAIISGDGSYANGAEVTAAMQEGYGKIRNQGGMLTLGLGGDVVFENKEAIMTLKSELFTEDSLDDDGILENGGILNIGQAHFRGYKVNEVTIGGVAGYQQSWDNLKSFADVYSPDTTNKYFTHTNVNNIDVSDEVKGHWGSLTMNTSTSASTQVLLAGDTSLSFASGNNGNFISDSTHNTPLGAVVFAGKSLTLNNGGNIGKITLQEGDDEFGANETDWVSTSLVVNGTGKTVVAAIEGTSATSGYTNVLVTKGAAAEVTNDIANIADVEAIDATLNVLGNSTSHYVGVEGTGAMSVGKTLTTSEAYVNAGTLSAKDFVFNNDQYDDVTIINGGRLTTETFKVTNENLGEIVVGLDGTALAEHNLAEGTTGTGFFEVTNALWLNGATLVVDPDYDQATSIASVNKFQNSNSEDFTLNKTGTIKGSVQVGANAALGIGSADVAEVAQAIAQYQQGGALKADKYGSILYLNGQIDVADGSEIALNADQDATDIRSSLVYQISNATTGGAETHQYADMGLGANTAVLMTEKAFDNKAGDRQGTAVEFKTQNAVVNGAGGEIVLVGSFDTTKPLNFFNDAGGNGVTVEGSITVRSQNGFLVTVLSGENQGMRESMEVNEPEARRIMTEASDPVLNTLIAYGNRGSANNGGNTPNEPETPADPGTDNGSGANEGDGGFIEVNPGKGNNSASESIAWTKLTPADGSGNSGNNEPPVTTASTGSSSFLDDVIWTSHGAPAEQAARLGVYGGSAQVGLAAAGSNADVLASRFGIGANSQSLNLAANGMGGTLWVAPIYKSQDSDGFAAQGLNYGVDFDLYGVALGGDYKVTNEITVGAMFNVGSGDLDGQGNTAAAGVSNDFDYFGFGLYGAYQAGALTVTADLSYTQVDNDLEGNNELGKVSASADTTAWSLGVTGQYQFTFASIDVTPHAGLRFTSLDLDDYGVNAAGHGTVANFDSDTMSVFSIPVGVTFAKSFQSETWTVTPALDLQVTGQFGDDEAEGSVSWSGTNLTTNVTSEVFDNFTYGATVGVEAQSVNGFSFGLGLGYTGSSNVDEFSAQANARFTF